MIRSPDDKAPDADADLALSVCELATAMFDAPGAALSLREGGALVRAAATGPARDLPMACAFWDRDLSEGGLIVPDASRDPRFFLGTDSAPHAKGLKEHACGCAGCYTAFHAMELYAQAFDAAGALDKLEAFSSFHGPAFYGLPRNSSSITLKRETWTLPTELPLGDASIVPLNGGEAIGWKLA